MQYRSKKIDILRQREKVGGKEIIFVVLLCIVLTLCALLDPWNNKNIGPTKGS